MSLPKNIVARFEIVTPMFLGDADQKATSIREASIKGALVFWWRALNFSSFVQENSGNQNDALKAMQIREQLLFGGGKSGQSAVLLKNMSGPSGSDVLPEGEALTKDGRSIPAGSAHNGDLVGEGARYLGYGVINANYTKENRHQKKPEKFAAELEKVCFKMAHSFSIKLIFAPKLQATDCEEILQALKVFGLLGGLGTRKRRGWGSVALLSLEGAGEWTAPTTREDYIKDVQGFLTGGVQTQVGLSFPLTAFAKETDIRIGTIQNANPLSVLNDLGAGFQRYRAYGRKPKNGGTHQVAGQDSEKNFQNDHDWFKIEERDKNTQDVNVPLRSIFGLPHNYTGLGVTANGNFDRRASPLMFHIHKAGNKCFAVAMHFPVQFLPEDQVSVWHGKQENKTPRNFVYSPNVINDFLNNQRPNESSPPLGPYFPNEKVLS